MKPYETILRISFHVLHPRYPEKKLIFSPDNFIDKNRIDWCMCVVCANISLSRKRDKNELVC